MQEKYTQPCREESDMSARLVEFFLVNTRRSKHRQQPWVPAWKTGLWYSLVGGGSVGERRKGKKDKEKRFSSKVAWKSSTNTSIRLCTELTTQVIQRKPVFALAKLGKQRCRGGKFQRRASILTELLQKVYNVSSKILEWLWLVSSGEPMSISIQRSTRILAQSQESPRG